MISTSDNPFNPWYNFDKWGQWDREHGYNTVSYLGELASILSAGGRIDGDELNFLVIDEVLEQNVTGNYVYVPKPDDVEDSEGAG